VLTDPVTLSIAPLTQHRDVCELCSVGPELLRAAVLVRHARGGTVQLSACSRCAAGVRRLIAVAGGAAAGGPASMQFDSEPAVPATSNGSPTSDTVGSPIPVHEFVEPFHAQDGQSYTPRVYGQERADGTWIGWLTFVGPDGQVSRTTGRETTQSNLEHLGYWATGLQPSYLEGAFKRAG
jgi:hypothetical protein